MPADIDRDELRRLVDQEKAQLAEVLPITEYEEFHLPGAIHLPLRKVETDSRSLLDPARPIIVYCWDSA